MKAKMDNQTRIEGYIYEHDLTMKITGDTSKNPGTEFISGTLSVATDDACINIVPVHFTYVTAMTAKGSSNATFTNLRNILDGAIGTIMKDGKENAGMVRIDSAIGLNEFYTDRNGTEELVTSKRNEGGFVHIVNSLTEDEKQRNTFKADMIITQVIHVDGDEERGTSDKAIVKGAIFDFRKSLLPVEFSAVNPNAMNYFEGLDVNKNNPVFTKVWGRQISEVITRTIVEESAFGEDSVREIKSSRKDFVITGAAKEPYLWDDESTITGEELKEAMANRELYLADIKRRQDEYKASKGAGGPAVSSNKETFNF